MTSQHELWDQKSADNFWRVECDLHNDFIAFDRDWTSADGLSPRDALARLERLKSAVNYLVSVAKTAG